MKASEARSVTKQAPSAILQKMLDYALEQIELYAMNAEYSIDLYDYEIADMFREVELSDKMFNERIEELAAKLRSPDYGYTCHLDRDKKLNSVFVHISWKETEG